MTLLNINELYRKQLTTPVDFGRGPRLPMHKKNSDTFLNFEPFHSGMGFVGTVPYEQMFFASDHHFGHKNIIKFCDRPFDSVEEMNEALIERHNSVVGPDDYCIFGGDISFAPASKANYHLSRMNGYKIFILGNHDFERDGSVKKYDVHESWLWWYPFGVQRDSEFKIIVSHYPLDGLPKDVVNIHGHIHDKLSDNPQHINMCVEHHDYTPVRMDRMMEIAKMRYEETIG